jgi:hypothetical protein
MSKNSMHSDFIKGDIISADTIVAGRISIQICILSQTLLVFTRRIFRQCNN